MVTVFAGLTTEETAELRERVLGEGTPIDRVETTVEALQPDLRLVDRRNWTRRIELHRDALQDALSMTYRGERRRRQERLAELDGMTVTLSADLLGFVGRRSARPASRPTPAPVAGPRTPR